MIMKFSPGNSPLPTVMLFIY